MADANEIDSPVLDSLRVEITTLSENYSRVENYCSDKFNSNFRDAVGRGIEMFSREIPEIKEFDSMILDLGVLSFREFETQFCQRVEQEIALYVKKFKKYLQSRVDLEGKSGAPIDSEQPSISGRGLRSNVLTQSGNDLPLTRSTDDAHENRAMLARACLFAASRLRLWNTFDRGELSRLLNAAEILTPDMLLLSALRYFQRNEPGVLRKRFPHPNAEVLEISVVECGSFLTELFDSPISAALLPWLRALWCYEPVRTLLTGKLTIDRVKEIQRVFDDTSFRKADMRKMFDAPLVRNSERWTVLNESTFREPKLQSVLSKRIYGESGSRQKSAGGATEIRVDNAGLVLLWPLLVDLLSRLDLWDKSRFVDLQSQINAACWLDALIWADDCAHEWRMPLTKWLCGLPLDCEIEWQAPDEETAGKLYGWLPMLSKQLPGWRTLSTHDIRTLFLQRPGELVKTEASLKLTVQREPFDILLNDWPWPLDQLMLPWLEKPLSIDWL